MSPDQLKFALLGCGAIARRHAAWLAAAPAAEITVCCDSRPEAAASLAADFAPRAAVETDWQSALRARPLDAVIVCSPNRLHFPQASAALRAGLHVLCEKPLAVERAEIEQLIQLRRDANRVLSIAHQRRYASLYTTARRELTDNMAVYGPLRTVHVYYGENWQSGARGTWRDDPRETAGFYADAGIHQIDVVRFITGRELRRVWATSERAGSNVEIVTQLAAELDDGARLAALWVGNGRHWREDMHFHGQRAELALRDSQLFRAAENSLQPITDLVPDDNPVAAFIRAARSGGETLTPPELALPICDYLSAVRESLLTGLWADVRPHE